MKVPCYYCLNCRKRRASSWSVRLVKEYERSHQAHFLTLTYNTDHLSFSKMGFPTLNKKDLQDFMKRLRKLHPPDHKTIRYYAVGEYGGQTKRPHYHLIIYNADINLFEKAWSLKNKSLGEIHIGAVGEASIGYCLKYITKVSPIGKDPKKDDRQKQFSLMSKRLGDNYLTQNMIKWHLNDLTGRVYVPLKDGKKAPLPRYYKEKLYNQSEKEEIAYQMTKLSNERIEKELKEQGDNYQSNLEQKYLDAQRKMNIGISSKI